MMIFISAWYILFYEGVKKINHSVFLEGVNLLD
jgi:hypothetical protein